LGKKKPLNEFRFIVLFVAQIKDMVNLKSFDDEIFGLSNCCNTTFILKFICAKNKKLIKNIKNGRRVTDVFSSANFFLE